MKDGIGGGTGETVQLEGDTTIETTNKLYFRDTGLYLNSSTDGQLDIVADTTVAISGAVTMDSTLALSGATTVGTTNKIQFRDTGLYLNSSTDGQLDIVADTTVAISGAVTMDSTLTMSAGKILLYPIGSAAASASGLLMGVGTSVSPATTSTASAKFVEIRAQTTATSGDNRLMYLRYDINGTTGGECLRAFTKVTAANTTSRGAHISLDMGNTSGSISGLGVGVDAQLLMGNTAYSAGTWAAVNSEIYSDGSSTDISGATFSFFRCVAGGDGTGAANVDSNAFLFDLSSGLTTASGTFIDTDKTTHTAYGGIPIKTDAGTLWLAVVSA